MHSLAPSYRDTVLYMVVVDYLDYAERLMQSFDKLFNQGVIRDLDEQIMGFIRSQDVLRSHLEVHRATDDQIPGDVLDDFVERLGTLTAHRPDTGYPFCLYQRHRAMIQETLQIFLSYRREAVRLAA